MASTSFAGMLAVVLAVLSSTATAQSSKTFAYYVDTWKLNAGNEYSSAPFLAGDDVLTDVTSAEISGDYVEVKTSGIPKYSQTITEEIYDALVSRPKVSSDFVNGAPSVSVGDEVEWGGDLGYTGGNGCASSSADTDERSGYWPPGPTCPTDQNLTAYFPTSPEPTTDKCYQPGGALGLYANGVAIYGWTDATSYNSEGVWYNLAAKFEVYDVDINSGHAGGGGQYHFHFASDMLSDIFNDTGDAKSAIFGFASDGYPIAGPYLEAGVKAQSCWKTRDYSDPAKGGCGTDGRRTCLLVDQWDLSQGTVEADSEGPSVDSYVTSLSSNNISVASGAYFEDYYYDSNCTDSGDEYLDSFNMRYDDELGTMVYHVTDDFPYNVGPYFYGKLHDNGLTSCQESIHESTLSVGRRLRGGRK